MADKSRAMPGSQPAPANSLLPALAVPKGGGAIRGIGETFTASAATGTGSLSIPIATSPGRGGFELGLQLQYDSAAGNGAFGLGWKLSTLAISRRSDRGLPTYTETDTFVLTGAEHLVPEGAAFDRGELRVQRFRPRAEGAFARIERCTARSTGDVHWRTTTRDNVLAVFGRTTQARIADPDDARRVFSWLLEETRDDRGNVTCYRYKGEDGDGVDAGRASEASRFDGTRPTAQRYLKRVHYGNREPIERDAPAPAGAAAWMFEVVFDYGEHDPAAPTPDEARPWTVRPDAFSSYRATFEVRTYRRCMRALVFHRFPELGPAPRLVSSTDLAYDDARIRTPDGAFVTGPIVSYLASITQAGYLRRADDTYERATRPPLSLDYVRPVLHDERHVLASDIVPGAQRGAAAEWVDLDGEGLPGVLVPTEHAWYYRAPLGDGRLAPAVVERGLPVTAVPGKGAQLVDLGGDGNLDLVRFAPPLAGYHARTGSREWAPFVPLPQVPNIDWNDPQLRTLDLDGDGLPDLAIARDDTLVWYRSLGAGGFTAATEVARPAVVFADGNETIHLADMSGDGLVDLVRVRNGEVCYWPNLGYGRFGRKLTLDNSPRFDVPELFDARRVRFADIDGSGASDVLYVGRDGVRIYFSHSGNALSAPFVVRALPVDAAADLAIVDLLGRGTASLVWSSTLPDGGSRPAAYVDLMGGDKPHLLASVTNNLGAQTRITYASSTAFYLADRAAGRAWLTRLAFPVQVVARVEHVDQIAGSRLVSRFAYRHGYFDGVEREFRGFARVDQWDAESVDTAGDERTLPPVHRITWFHTGAWLEHARLERELAAEYYAGDPLAARLPDTIVPDGLTAQEEREAARVLAGSMLREEIYAEDGVPASAHPYAVTERSYSVRQLQRATASHPGVFLAHPQDSVTLHYERRPDDPRVQHEVVVDVDDFGNITRSAAIAYPRRVPVEPEQARLWMTVSEASFANRPDEVDWYRVGVPVATTTSELTGLAPVAGELISASAVRAALAAATELPYEATANASSLEKRAIARTRIRYWRDDLAAPLPLGTIESRALVHESYRAAMTPGLVAQVFGARISDPAVFGQGGYVAEDGLWWAPSGRVVVDPARFFLPVEAIDPFGQRYRVRYDAHALLPVESEDALGDRVTAENDYRVLGPVVITDANQNRSAVAVDALGQVVATAVMGKLGAGEGDTLEDPTTSLAYDLHRWLDSGGTEPAVVHVRAREQHGAANSRWQDSFHYTDGSGRTAMTKVRAADGRWIGTGRTVFDNKGNPVKQYEPYFSTTSAYESAPEIVESGVTAIRRYDPLGRLVRTDLPDDTIVRVAFDAWQHAVWDPNDTVAESGWLARALAGDTAAQRSAALAIAHAGTPTLAHLDARGRTVATVADNGPGGQRVTRYVHDVEGHQLAVTDPRGVVAVTRVYDLLGRAIHETSADAGDARTLPDVGGRSLLEWSARGHVLRNLYDPLRRLTHQFARLGASPETLVERIVYGESAPDAELRNLHGAIHQVYDGAGVVVRERFDVDGNPIETTRRLAADYRLVPDWAALATLTTIADIEAAAASALEAETFTTVTVYDALDRLAQRSTPDGTQTAVAYDDGGRVARIEARVRGAATPTMFVADAEYNARGQRVRVEYGNATTCTYAYDPQTFRLRVHETRRNDGRVLQHLTYTYDPVGNVVEVADAVAFGNSAVSADGRYEYDPIYQLVVAEGREHPGMQPTELDAALLRVDHPADLQALRRYRQTCAYDVAGNLLEVAHQPLGAGPPGWTRRSAYAADSNRLVATSLPGDPPGTFSATYAHDAHGNVTAMPHLAVLAWDHLDRLQRAERGGGGTVFFASDTASQRIRKAYEHGAFVEERIYLDGLELYRKRGRADGAVVLERQTLAIHDETAVAALVETKTIDLAVPAFTPVTRMRYQRTDHLGSTAMELDEVGAVISYEEHYPFGATSWRASSSATDVSARRYRYLGKERDEETGLYALGPRYYAAWLGRWTSPDPAGYVDGTNLYRYARNNPVSLHDPSGTDSGTPIGDVVKKVMEEIIAKRAAPAAATAATTTVTTTTVTTTTTAAASGAPAAGGAAAGGPAILYATPVLVGLAIAGTGYLFHLRMNNIAQSGNFTGVHNPGMGILQHSRTWMARPVPPVVKPKIEPAPDQELAPRAAPKKKDTPKDKDDDKKRKPKPGRIYVTYQKYNRNTGLYYSGRTSMIADLNKPLRPQAELAVALRDANHHINTDENEEPQDRGFDPAYVDKFDIGKAVNYADRYQDEGYLSIRGREQQLIDYRGGAQSETGEPYQTENAIRGVAKDHDWARRFHDMATARFGEELHRYTGN